MVILFNFQSSCHLFGCDGSTIRKVLLLQGMSPKLDTHISFILGEIIERDDNEKTPTRANVLAHTHYTGSGCFRECDKFFWYRSVLV